MKSSLLVPLQPPPPPTGALTKTSRYTLTSPQIGFASLPIPAQLLTHCKTCSNPYYADITRQLPADLIQNVLHAIVTRSPLYDVRSPAPKVMPSPEFRLTRHQRCLSRPLAIRPPAYQSLHPVPLLRWFSVVLIKSGNNSRFSDATSYGSSVQPTCPDNFSLLLAHGASKHTIAPTHFKAPYTADLSVFHAPFVVINHHDRRYIYDGDRYISNQYYFSAKGRFLYFMAKTMISVL